MCPISPSPEQVDLAVAPVLPLADPPIGGAATGRCDLQAAGNSSLRPPGERRMQEQCRDSRSRLSHCRRGSWGCSAPSSRYPDPKVQLE